MGVDLRHCGPAANRSEVTAFNRLKAGLASLQTEGDWVLLANLTLSVTNQRQSDEIDIVAIGPRGVRVIEVKHWTDRHRSLAGSAADLLNMKARRVRGKIGTILPADAYVDSAVLITQPPSKAVRLLKKGKIHGVPFCSLAKDWQKALGLERRESLTPEQVAATASRLQPRRLVGPDGSLREFCGYVNLELLTPPESTFHRVYRGVQSARQDRLLLHLYDFSSGEGANLETIARREFEALHRLQRYSWAPRIYDSFQDAPNYPAEMKFFSVVDREAPNIAERLEDESWGVLARLDFARSAVRALAELHAASDDDRPMLHRNLSPETILVKHDNSPVFTGFEHARIPSDITLVIDGVVDGEWSHVVSPEMRSGGLGAASPQSDIYALCSSLQVLFSDEHEDWRSKGARKVLAAGRNVVPDDRVQLAELDRELTELLGEPLPPSPAPPARFWGEGQVVPFRGREYRIVTRLGSGGVGTAFKVVELDHDTEKEVGTFVGKVAYDATRGERAGRSYQLAREPVSKHLALASVFEVATEWQENEFVALATWIDGSALADFTGLVPLLAEENQEDPQELAARWLRTMCEALDTMHRNGLVHGDVSPRNMILSGEDLVLTDYDCVARIGDPKRSVGATLYSAPANQTDVGEVAPADDIYALAASFFHVLFDKEPFARDGERLQKGALNWERADRDEYPDLVEFFERAVHADSVEPLHTAADALAALTKGSADDPDLVTGESARLGANTILGEAASKRSPNEVPWLRKLLTSYPGSRWGNRETRGLDTGFAAQTYVETSLEKELYQDIVNRRARLIILCGNAGDGKTAMLQHLAESLGMGQYDSSRRIIDRVIQGGLRVRMNLDGSAAFQGRSADEMLDEFLEPFQQKTPEEDIVHLLAINDGRLLEWIDRPPNTPLKSSLQDLLETSSREPERNAPSQKGIAFHHLNMRSHVGNLVINEDRIATTFLERLLDGLYGGPDASDTWKPCRTCSAQESCGVFRATRVFGPDGVLGAQAMPMRDRARERLFSALQAVHFRGETHITVRELRSALVYILFGTHYCTDYHDRTATPDRAYWDRAFAPESPRRQGEVLRELVHLDPALEAHPKIDSQLLRDARLRPREHPQARLASERRRAYFEWTEDQIAEVAKGDPERSLGLAQGRNLPRFRDIPLLDEVALGDLCADLCGGVARLGDLPPLALERAGIVPLRIPPRTPTETGFWTEKPLSRFRLASDSDSDGGDHRNVADDANKHPLHRKVHLVYRYRDGHEERLRLSAGLFHRLLRLREGFQLGDVSTDDTFANLSVFLRRLVQEDDRELMAWNPMRDETVYRVSAEFKDGPSGLAQGLTIRRTESDGGSTP